jgi:hypothetical protein
MEKRLSLASPAEEIARLAMSLNLPNVPPDGLPTLYLAPVFVRHPPSHVIAAIPLEPAAWVVRMDPALGAPHRQRLACTHAEKIERAIAAGRRKLGAPKPAFGKLLAAIRHVLAAKYSKPEHLLGRELGLELGIKTAADRRRRSVTVTLLHPVMHRDGSNRHLTALIRACGNQMLAPDQGKDDREVEQV